MPSSHTALPQSKMVYLFELDSVRKTDEEIIAGQKRLYEEIVHLGNTVVLTYNQLVDSRAFFSLLAHDSTSRSNDGHPDYFESFVTLFEQGHIRLAQYGNIRTISQYLLESIAPDKHFIYSALPVKSSQRRLLALMRRSLTYSDLSEIDEYRHAGEPGATRTETDIRDLFVEVEGQKASPSPLTLPEMHAILDSLSSLIETVLRLSTLHGSFVPPRAQEELDGLRLSDILAKVLSFRRQNDSLWKRATSLLREIHESQPTQNNRSVYLQQLREEAKKEQANCLECKYAEAIVDLCFNYACEISICNTSKRYDVEELRPGGAARGDSFKVDFFRQLDDYWDAGRDVENRFPSCETNRYERFGKVDLIPDFSKAVRLCSYEDSRATDTPTLQYVPCYAEDIERQELTQKRKILSFIGRSIAVSVACLLITVLLEFASGWLQDALDLQLNVATPVFGAIETILFLLLSEGVSVLIQKVYSGFPSLSEALGKIFGLLRDAIQTLGWQMHTRPSDPQLGFRESPARTAPIRYIVPRALSRYLAMARSNSSDFSESDIYPIANVGNPKVIEKIVRQEEITLEEFGLIYESPFNTLLSDPIVSPDSGDGTSRAFFPYERMLPTAGNGVVIATIHKGKFVLLKQYRHALRSYQLSFPRGFAEPGADGRENVLRELSEELHAVPSKEPHFIGKIAPDSGLTSRVTEVYSVCIESFCETRQEGIAEVIEIDATELAHLIGTGDINDGYTIGAFALWQLGNNASIETPAG